MKTVLVTGGFSDRGALLCKKLLRLGYHVICVDTGSTDRLHRLNILSNPRFKIINEDIVHMPSFGVAIDFIFHMACIDDKYDPLEKMRVCFEGTQNVLNIADTHGSTVMVVTGKNGENFNFDNVESLVSRYVDEKHVKACVARVQTNQTHI
jgi:nucleoside-diphosphate-sugar epimerase